MADEPVQSVTAPAPAPAEATPSPSPAAPVQSAQAPSTVQPAEGIVTGSDTTVSQPGSEPAPSSSLIGDAIDKSKAAEAVQPEPSQVTQDSAQTQPEAIKNEGGQTEQAPPPKYDPWILPEGVTLDEARVGEFASILSLLETEGKADHAILQREGQKLVDFHVNEVKNAVERLTEYYQTSWDKQKTDWKEAFLKDPDIGGNRSQTTLDSALSFIRTHGGNEEQQKEFRQLMDTSGLGNHPAMIRLLANAGLAMREGRPLAAPKPVMQSRSKTQTMYGKG